MPSGRRKSVNIGPTVSAWGGVTPGEDALAVAHPVAGPDHDAAAGGRHGHAGILLVAELRHVDPRLAAMASGAVGAVAHRLEAADEDALAVGVLGQRQVRRLGRIGLWRRGRPRRPCTAPLTVIATDGSSWLPAKEGPLLTGVGLVMTRFACSSEAVTGVPGTLLTVTAKRRK